MVKSSWAVKLVPAATLTPGTVREAEPSPAETTPTAKMEAVMSTPSSTMLKRVTLSMPPGKVALMTTSTGWLVVIDGGVTLNVGAAPGGG